MNLLDVVRSGRPFRRLDQTPYWIELNDSTPEVTLSQEDILADDYVLKVNTVRAWKWVLRSPEQLPDGGNMIISQGYYTDEQVRSNLVCLDFVQKIESQYIDAEVQE